MAGSTDTFSVRLAGDVRPQMDELARLTRRSRSFIVKEAVAAYIRDRAAYLRDLDAISTPQS